MNSGLSKVLQKQTKWAEVYIRETYWIEKHIGKNAKHTKKM